MEKVNIPLFSFLTLEVNQRVRFFCFFMCFLSFAPFPGYQKLQLGFYQLEKMQTVFHPKNQLCLHITFFCFLQFLALNFGFQEFFMFFAS